MLKKYNRLAKNNDFDRVFKEGKSVFSKFLGVKVLKNDLEINRFGILVGIKISKKAVERNRIKRRIREAIKQESASIRPGFDIVITTSKPILEKTFPEIQSALRAGFQRLRLLK